MLSMLAFLRKAFRRPLAYASEAAFFQEAFNFERIDSAPFATFTVTIQLTGNEPFTYASLLKNPSR